MRIKIGTESNGFDSAEDITIDFDINDSFVLLTEIDNFFESTEMDTKVGNRTPGGE